MQTLRNAINCWVVRLWLVPRAEGSEVPVPLFVLKWFNEHLDTCKRCRSDLKDLRLTTFALRRAAYGAQRKTGDPYFADRVVNRVRQAEDARRRRLHHTRSFAASLSAVATFFVMLVWLGIFNPLKAEWFPFNPKSPVPVARTVTAPSYGEHDPFDPENIGLPLNGNEKVHQAIAAAKETNLALKPIPDYLTPLNLTKPPVLILTHTKTVTAASPLPLSLAASPYQLQDRHTPPAILSSGNQSTGLAIVEPTPSDPGNASTAISVAATNASPAAQSPVSVTPASATVPSSSVQNSSTTTNLPVTNQPAARMVTPTK
jgi:hypothetical protein